MRPARLISGDRLAVVLVAHGSRDPRAAASTEALARAVRRAHPEWTVHASYLDHAGPRPLDVLTAMPPGRRAVVVPLLLTAAYHGRVDVPAILAEAAGLAVDVRLAEVLGPLPGSPAVREVAPRLGVGPGLGTGHGLGVDADLRGRGVDADLRGRGVDADLRGLGVGAELRVGLVPGLLIDGLVRRLPSDGLDAVVLAAAGTRDAAARETISWAAEALSARLSLPCAAAYASAAPPAAGEVVARLRAEGARRVGVAAYFLAPGFLYDLAVRSALDAGATSVADPLGDAPEMVQLVAERVESAAARSLASAA